MDRARTDARRDILDAAARIFKAKGYRAATLRDIASAVGMKAGSIYYHFASKQEIVAAVMNDGIDYVRSHVASALGRLPSSATPDKRFEAAVLAHLQALLEYNDYTSAGLNAYRDAPEYVRKTVRPHRDAYEDVWRELIEELAEVRSIPQAVSPETVRLAILGAMNWSPQWYRPSKHKLADLARELSALVVR